MLPNNSQMYTSYSVYDIIHLYMGLNVKLDVGLYRLNQQVACQRYMTNFLDATSKFSGFVASVREVRDNIVGSVAAALTPAATVPALV